MRRGHLGIEDGYSANFTPSESRRAEAIADAHTLIRHYQRFGMDQDYVDPYVTPFARANSLIFHGDISHFTGFVLEEIMKCRNAVDFANLSPERTPGIARQFARQYTPPLETLNELRNAFKPVKTAWAAKDHAAAVQKLIDVTLDEKSSHAVFRTGNMWLQKYLEGSITVGGKTLVISNENKQSLARKLTEREYHFARISKHTKHRATPQEWKKLGLGN